MKYILRVASVVMCLSVSMLAVGENVKGVVRSATGEPMLGAVVSWAQTSVGTTTHAEGDYSINRVKDYNQLVASFIGFESDTITVSSDMDRADFVLKQSGVDLGEIVVNSSIRGNYIEHGALAKSEMISFAGLCKMACCNLAESFENSASVTVGFSDAISGARQIQMLGLAGTYTQILDESRPILRGISAPYGLSYTPGMWLNSIQVSKGVSSVTAGHEAVTGQINLEMRKPTDEERLFLNLYINNELRPEINISTAQPVTADGRLSTVVLFHASADTDPKFVMMDHNGDGFRDMPLAQQFNLSNRWLYQAENGAQIRWGVRALQESRLGGDLDYESSMRDDMQQLGVYGSEIRNRNLNAFLKVGMPVGASVYDAQSDSELRPNIAMVLDFDHFDESAYFGLNDYSGKQNSAMLNMLYNGYVTPRSSYVIGASASAVGYDESVLNPTPWLGSSQNYLLDREEVEVGLSSEYTYKNSDVLSVVVGARADYNSYFDKLFFTPRGHIRWGITESTTLRGSAGLGYRTTNVLTDNIWTLATGRKIIFAEGTDASFNRMEQALTWGGSLTQRFSLLKRGDATLSAEYFRTQFYNQVVVDQEQTLDKISIYANDGRAFTDTYQLDFTWAPAEGLDIFATYRYTNSLTTLERVDGTRYEVERPLVSKFKTLLNVQYATPYRRWVFDATAQLNGPSRLPSQVADAQSSEYSPIYPMFFAQVSHRVRSWDIYVGCENIANYTQDQPIIGAQNPFDTAFNSSVVWGPLMGRKFYIGARFNLY